MGQIEKIFHIMEKIFLCQMEKIFALDILHGDYRKTYILLPLIAPRARARVCVRARGDLSASCWKLRRERRKKGKNRAYVLANGCSCWYNGQGGWAGEETVSQAADAHARAGAACAQRAASALAALRSGAEPSRYGQGGRGQPQYGAPMGGRKEHGASLGGASGRDLCGDTGRPGGRGPLVDGGRLMWRDDSTVCGPVRVAAVSLWRWYSVRAPTTRSGWNVLTAMLARLALSTRGQAATTARGGSSSWGLRR